MIGPVLAIEQSGPFCRAVIFDSDRRQLASVTEEIRTRRPRPGTAQHDADELWTAVLAVCRAAIGQAQVKPEQIAAVGIAADADTAVLWERETGKVLHPVLAAGDRRAEARVAALLEAGVNPIVLQRAGQRLDARSPAMKLSWLLDNADNARNLAEEGRLAFAPIAGYLLWRLTDGRVHAIDATTAAATLLYSPTTQNWDPTLVNILSTPLSVLPQVFDNATYFGAFDAAHFGGSGPLGVNAMATTEHAAMIGQSGVGADRISVIIGTGCRVLTGIRKPVARVTDRDQLTIGSRIGGTVHYARTGASEAATGAISWVLPAVAPRQGLAALEKLAGASEPNRDLFIAPAGIGGQFPWFKGNSPGLTVGVQPETRAPDLVRAALETIGFAANDIIRAMVEDEAALGEMPIRVTGIFSRSDWLLQFLADLLNAPVARLQAMEVSALGVAWLAAFGTEIWPDSDTFIADLPIDAVFEPTMPQDRRQARIEGWRRAVGLALAANG